MVTVLYQGSRSDRPRYWTLTFNLHCQSKANYGHDPQTHTHKSSSSKVSRFKNRVDIDGQTDRQTHGRCRLLYLPANAVGNNLLYSLAVCFCQLYIIFIIDRATVT